MMPKPELIFSTLGKTFDWLGYPRKQTACLLIVDHAISDELVASIVNDAIDIGCTFFMTWGRMADELHDKIDFVLETGRDEWLSIVTTSHGGEPAEDVAAFLFAGTFPGSKEFRCLIIGDRPVDELRGLILCPE